MNELDVRQVGDCHVVMPSGERIDASNAARFRTACIGALPSNARAVIDLSNLRFIDSSGIGALVAVARHLDETSQLGLVVNHPSLRSLLEITRIDQVLTVHDNLASATA